MAELQTTYSDTIAAGYPGMVVNGETSNRITRTIETAAGVGYEVHGRRVDVPGTVALHEVYGRRHVGLSHV